MKTRILILIFVPIIIGCSQKQPENNTEGSIVKIDSSVSFNKIKISSVRNLYDSIEIPYHWNEQFNAKGKWETIEVDPESRPHEIWITITTNPEVRLSYSTADRKASYKIINVTKKKNETILVTLINEDVDYIKQEDGLIHPVNNKSKLNDTAIWLFSYVDFENKIGIWRLNENNQKDTLTIGRYISLDL